MHNKSRKNLHKYLMQVSSADDVTSNHAYGRVAKKHKHIPKRRLSQEKLGGGAVASYRDSMVGSVAQYHSKPIPRPAKTEDSAQAHSDTKQDQDIIGNRPRSGAEKSKTNGQNSVEHRHHFVEPPKRNFHRFD